MARSFDSRSLNQRRRTWLALMAGAAGAALSNTFLPRSVLANAERPSDGVHRMEGPVSINGGAAKPGLPVQPGDTIKTGSDGQAIIVLGEHAFLLQEDTEVVLFGGVADDVLRIISGRMLSVFGKGKLTIETPLTTIGIRGTAVYAEHQKDRDYVCVCYGHADLGQKQTGQHLETVETTHHESPRYIYAPGNTKTIEKAKVINHTDSELIMLEWLLWRHPPFYEEDDNDSGGGGY